MRYVMLKSTWTKLNTDVFNELTPITGVTAFHNGGKSRNKSLEPPTLTSGRVMILPPLTSSDMSGSQAAQSWSPGVKRDAGTGSQKK